MKGLLANRFVLAFLLIAAVGAELVIASAGRPMSVRAGIGTAPPAKATVSSLVRACAAPGSAGATAAGLALATASAGTGKAEVSRLSAAGSPQPPAPVRVLSEPGRLTRASVPVLRVPAHGPARKARPATAGSVPTESVRGGVMIAATGSMARGLEVEQTGPDGLTSMRCGEPGTDFWFVAPGQRSAATILLYLMDTDSQPATAEVDIYTDSGPLLASTDTGIAVPAHGMIVQSLAKLAHGSRVLALHVNTSVGRLVAAVRETTKPNDPGAWLPAAQPPAKHIVLPGLPTTPGTRSLYVVVPGTGNAEIKLTAVTAKGSYAPTGGSGIDLPGGSAVQVALPSLSGIAAAIKLRSNVPVTATMAVPGGETGAPGALTAAAGPVQQQGVIAGNTGPVSLVLSAPQAAAQVRIGTETTAAAGTGTVVRIGAGKTSVVKVKAPAGAGKTGYALVLTPLAGSGPVYAGRVVLAGARLRAILPVLSSLSWVPLPPVRSSLTAALP